MKTSTTIIITVILTILLLVGGYFCYQYELSRNQSAYQKGYIVGLLYPQQSGNIAVYDGENLTEITIEQICLNLNNQGGK